MKDRKFIKYNNVAQATSESEEIVVVIENDNGLPNFKVGEEIIEVDINNWDYLRLLEDWTDSDWVDRGNCKAMIDAFYHCYDVVRLLSETALRYEYEDLVFIVDGLNETLMNDWKMVLNYVQ